MQCKYKVKSRNKKTHQDLPRFNHNVWSTSSQDLRKVFFHYCNQQLQGGMLIYQVLSSLLHKNLSPSSPSDFVQDSLNLTVLLSKLHSNLKVYKCLKVVQI